MFQVLQAGGLSGFATTTQTPLRSLADWRRHGPACTGAAFEPASMPGALVCLAIGVFRSFAPSSSAATRRCGPETAMTVPQKPADRLPAFPANPHSIGHMSEDNELSCVVGSIYDAALDPVRWTDALAKI